MKVKDIKEAQKFLAKAEEFAEYFRRVVYKPSEELHRKVQDRLRQRHDKRDATYGRRNAIVIAGIEEQQPLYTWKRLNPDPINAELKASGFRRISADRMQRIWDKRER